MPRTVHVVIHANNWIVILLDCSAYLTGVIENKEKESHFTDFRKIPKLSSSGGVRLSAMAERGYRSGSATVYV